MARRKQEKVEDNVKYQQVVSGFEREFKPGIYEAYWKLEFRVNELEKRIEQLEKRTGVK